MAEQVVNKVTAEEVRSACSKLKAAGIGPLEANRGQIRKVCGVGDRRARTIREWIRRGGCEIEQAETQELKGDSWIVALPKTRICTLEQLLEHCKVDLSEWEVERFVANKWEVGAKSEWTEKIDVEPLFQVKAWFRRKKAVSAAKDELAALKAEWKAKAPVLKSCTKVNPTGNLLEISIPDLHVGKLAWAKETGWENYDSKIAEQVFFDALEALITRTASYDFERVLLVVGNDLLHSDNTKGTTTGGTQLDVDGRYQKTFVQVRRMMTQAINRLRKIAPVDVVMVPGNHDQLTTWHLGDSLECLYANTEDVEVNNDPTLRKYYQFGNVMLMLTHGNRGKLGDYPLVMATEQPKMFGETLYREAHTGDKHQLKVQELHGVRVRISPALCPPDAWHSENLFVGNARSAEAFVWNREEGLIGSATYTVPAPKY